MADNVTKILAAIEKQRWYFFENKTDVVFDKTTGLLWSNLDTFTWHDVNELPFSFSYAIRKGESFRDDSFGHWKVPSVDDFRNAFADKTFPFQEGRNYRIKNNCYWLVILNNYQHGVIDLDNLSIVNDRACYVILCNDSLIKNSDYLKKKLTANYSVQKAQATLDLFVENELVPIFDNYGITELYKQTYFEESLVKTEGVKTPRKPSGLSSGFDYKIFLGKYNLNEIDSSPIKFYKAIQSWTSEIIEKLDSYDEEKSEVFSEFNTLSLQLSKKYDVNPNLTEAENNLLSERQEFFSKNFSIGMNTVKTKILALKKQADNLEYRLDEINNNSDSLTELAKLEKENRPSFAFIAENTAEIIRNALLKIEYFEKNKSFVENAIKILKSWNEDYLVFKTINRDALKKICTDDGIDEEIFLKMYSDWEKLRFKIEAKLQPLIEYSLKSDINFEGIIKTLEDYKKSIDKFFIEERVGIYQKIFLSSGAGSDLTEKFEVESELYKRTMKFQSELQEIIFSSENSYDKYFILNWANDLLDIQIDEILNYVNDKDLGKITGDILDEFAKLKLKNYDMFLTDARAYSESQAQREKQYNSLMFKMSRDLVK